MSMISEPCQSFRPLKSELFGEGKRCADCGKLESEHNAAPLDPHSAESAQSFPSWEQTRSRMDRPALTGPILPGHPLILPATAPETPPPPASAQGKAILAITRRTSDKPGKVHWGKGATMEAAVAQCRHNGARGVCNILVDLFTGPVEDLNKLTMEGGRIEYPDTLTRHTVGMIRANVSQPKF